jgi:tRNA dimethylallyltransferase
MVEKKYNTAGLRRRLPSVYAIVGPTASGKSAFAVRLAKKIDGEIISADSRQVYRGLTIGTGKITKKEMRGVPHHLLDVADPKKQFTVSEFVKRGRDAISEISSRGKTPIIVGGTGFYIDALFGRVTLPEVPPNEKLRKTLSKLSTARLFSMLYRLDPRRAAAIDEKNPVRLIRAIEIAKTIGKVPRQVSKSRYEVTWVGLSPANLRRRIRARLLTRMRGGMVSEAKRLHRKGLSYKRMRELGLEYRFLADLLEKKISKEDMVEKLETTIWQYSRRQMTWWRKNKHIRWKKV